MLNQNSKLFRGAVALALYAALATNVLAAAPQGYMLKNYTPGIKGSYALALSSPSLAFGPVVAGNASASQTVTLSNVGASPIQFTSFAADVGFTQTNDCGFIMPGANCQASVTFLPPAIGAYAGNLVANYDGGRIATVALTGTGTPSSAVATLTGPNLTFGSVQAGASSTPQTLTLSNSGGNDLAIASITSDKAEFTVTQGCTTVAPGAQCTIGVTFNPVAAGLVTGTLTVLDNAAGSPRTRTLSGTGLSPEASLSNSVVAFHDVAVGASDLSGVQIDNTGNQALSIGSIIVAGDAGFSAQHNCLTTLAVGAPGCVTNVTFAPGTGGPATGTLTFTTNAPDSPHVVSLSGTGLQGLASVTPNPLAFGDRVAGSAYTLDTTLTNGGTATLAITSIVAAGPGFTQTNTCGTSLAVGASCIVTVTFAPTVGLAQAYPGTLTLTDVAPGGIQTVALSGTGTASIAQLSTTPNAYAAVALPSAFGNVALGGSQSYTYYVYNGGNASLTLGAMPVALTTESSADATGNVWRIGSNTCASATIAAGASCSFELAYWPVAEGSDNGSVGAALTVTTAATGGGATLSLPVTGTGSAAIAQLSATSDSYTVVSSPSGFGSVAVGASQARTYYVLNSGNASMTLGTTPVAVTQSYTDVTNNVWRLSSNTCANASVAAGGSCSFILAYVPVAAGVDNSGTGATVAVTTPATGGGSSLSMAVTGTGTTSIAQLSSSSSSYVAVANPSAFGNVTLGTPATSTYYVYNSGTAPMTLAATPVSLTTESSYDSTNNVWQISQGTCANAVIAASASCSFTLTYAPATAGVDNGGSGSVITVATSATGGGSAITLGLTGTGVTPLAGSTLFTASTTLPPNTVTGLGYYAANDSFYAFDAANTRKVVKAARPATPTTVLAAFANVSASAQSVGMSNITQVSQGGFVGTKGLTEAEDTVVTMTSKYVIYDVDGTLTKTATTIPSLATSALESAPVSDGSDWYICADSQAWKVSGTSPYGITGPVTIGGSARNAHCTVDPSTGNLWVGYFLYSNPYQAYVAQLNKSTFALIGNVALPSVIHSIYPGFDAYGQMYVFSENDWLLYRVNKATGAKTTVAGNGSPGTTDGTGASARLNSPRFTIQPANQNVYFTDSFHLRVLY